MATLVLDTNVVSYLMKGHTLAEQYRQHLEGNTLAISFMTVGEMFEGAFRKNWSENNVNKLRETLKSYLVIPYSPGICETYGRIRTERRHQPIAVDDAMIAATALAYGCPLVTHNARDFEGISGLVVITEHHP